MSWKEIIRKEDDKEIINTLSQGHSIAQFVEGLVDVDKLPKDYAKAVHNFKSLMIMLDPENQTQGYEGSWEDYR